ncbi:MAG: TonB-dependent receptor, partial [Bryobacteraceae bacterium]
LGQVIDSHQTVELPLNGRNFMQLANISSGVVPAYNGRSATITNQSGRSDLAVHVSGGRGDANSYLIDGVETRSTWFNSPSVLLSVDAIREFKIEKNGFSAEYGQGSGIVSLVSKSGSNELHGTAYEFLRNSDLDAANYFDNYFSNQKAPFKQNQYGVTAGGAIVKNKLFFFGNWESLRSRKSNTLHALVPTPAQLAGDLTGLTSTKGAILDPSSGLPFPGNRIPANRISSVTKNFIQYTPVPNVNVPGTNFVTAKSTNRDDLQYGIRIDYQISASDSLFGRYTNFDSTLYQPGIGVLAGNNFPYGGQNAVIQETHIFSPRLLNVINVAYNRSNVFNSWENTPTSIANAIGIKIHQTSAEYGLPGVGVSGGFYVGGGAGINQGGLDSLPQFNDTLSWVRDRQTFKFGADIRFSRFDERLGLSNNGSFTFDGRYTGSSVADFLLGDTAAMTAQIGLGVGHWRSKSLNFFVTDDVKVTPKLTLNLGLRYEYDQPFYDRDHHEGYFDTSLGAFVVGISQAESPIKVNIPGIVYNPNLRPGIWYPDYNNFGPRAGFAYQLTNNTVIRGGYGLFYAKTQGNELQFKINAPPLVFAASLTGSPTTPNLNWDRDAFPDPSAPNFPVTTLSPFSVDPRDRTPYIQEWNFGVQHSFSNGWLAEASYAGNKGTKLDERVNINQAYLPDPAAITPIVTRRPFPSFGDILSSNLQENSDYDALQTRLEKRFDNGFSILAGYTYSHAIDTASRGSGGSWHQNAHLLRQDRGDSDFDVRHRFTASYIYELPFGHGKRFFGKAKGFADKLAGGWGINGISTFMTGNYFSVTVPGDRANVGGFPFQRANRSCDGNLSGGDRTINRYFDTSCFSLTPLGTFGNGGRNIVEIPGLNNWDISVVKGTPLTERIATQLRFEFFNIFNHAQFNQPDLTTGDVLFGAIRSARDGRISQMALKIIW